MITSISKHGPVFQYQKNDAIYYASNKMYFDRGAYARPWPSEFIISGYLKSEDATDTLDIQVRACSSNEVILSASDAQVNISDGYFKWTCLVPASELDAFYVEIDLMESGGDYYERELYSNALTPTGSDEIDVETGILIRLQENTRARRVEIELNLVTHNQPITWRVYRVNPHNLSSKTLLYTGQNSDYVGMSGPVTADILLDPNAWSAIWNPGDLLLFTIQEDAADEITVSVRSSLTEIDASAQYYSDGVLSSMIKLAGISVFGFDCFFTELLVQTNDPLLLLQYDNVRPFDGIEGETALATWIKGNFWEPDYPAEMEDIEILPGEFTRVRNEQHRTKKLETEFMPGYRHEHMKTILACDGLNLEGTEVIMRNDYTNPFNNRHYGLSKGMVVLTERPSILRNIR